MKRTLWNTLPILASTVALSTVLQAQGRTIQMSLGPNGVMSMSPVTMGNDQGQGDEKAGSDELRQLLGQDASDSKHVIIVLDSVRAGKKELADFAASLRAGKVRIRPGGVQTLAGDSKDAAKYGVGADDRVIVISTEAVTPPPTEKKP